MELVNFPMNDIAKELIEIVEAASQRLLDLPETQREAPGSSGAWSAKQVLGHLIDSAANNHPRFVRAQFIDDLLFPGYDQEAWVQAQRYEDEAWPALVELWRAYNRHLAHVLAHIPEAALKRPRHPHTLDKIAWKTVPAGQPATLEYLARDYIGHLNAHLEQLFAAGR